MTRGITFSALPGIGNVAAGDDLAGILHTAIAAAGFAPVAGDVLVVAQKIISKAEGRTVDLATVTPSPRAVELILSESSEVLRAVPNVLIVRHRLGYVMANAGIDHSNVMSEGGARQVLLLPLDADASAAALRDKLTAALGCKLGVIISDSFGRPWRNGVVNVALGAAGLPALIDRRGEKDLYGRTLEMTQVAFADALAAGAGLAMGEGAEGTPAVLVQGLAWQAPACPAQVLIRPLEEDLFQ